ncbi:MAG: RNA-directed DNA polymerase [Prevotella sp.]|nr:RNA-directed DNA polymerase [Prevotella sp.]
MSDILPYECPLFFTNRFFARFLKYYGIKTKDGRLVATKHQCDGLEEMLRLLGGASGSRRPSFQYVITKDGHEKGRQLTVIHPYHQVQMIEFYDRYKTVLIDFCRRSHYSIRFPFKVATVQKRPKGFPRYISDDAQDYNTEESIKHFFAYRHYHNINNFYDDYRFLRAEKKFSMMDKSDLSHCFDSIRPEMLSQAMFDTSMAAAEGAMPHAFYLLNQSFENHSEEAAKAGSDGIVIGPEFSRLYAEIILQRVDHDTERRLQDQGLQLHQDYLFYRYVDDGFLFFNSLDVRDMFYSIYDDSLKAYGLARKDNPDNSSKKRLYDHRPFLENITAGKLALLELIDSQFENRLDTFRGFQKMQSGHYDTPTFLNYKNFVRSVRAIMGTYSLCYKDVMSYILGIMQKRLKVLLLEFDKLFRQYTQAEYIGELNTRGASIKQQYEQEFIVFTQNLAETLFYLYSCDPRMSTSIKVVSIINRLQLYVRGRYRFDNGEMSAKFNRAAISSLDETISDQTQALLNIPVAEDGSVLEILNLLELQKCMHSSVQIQPRDLIVFFEKNDVTLNFFTIFETIHFIKNDQRYESLKEKLTQWIFSKVKILADSEEISETEAVLVFFEALCCPWVSHEVKDSIVALSGVTDEEQKRRLKSFAAKQKELFVKWRNYSIIEELQHINNTEVY